MSSRAQYDALYRRSLDDPGGFWGEIAREFHWHALTREEERSPGNRPRRRKRMHSFSSSQLIACSILFLPGRVRTGRHRSTRRAPSTRGSTSGGAARTWSGSRWVGRGAGSGAGRGADSHARARRLRLGYLGACQALLPPSSTEEKRSTSNRRLTAHTRRVPPPPQGGRTNVCFNCLDRHVAAGHGGRVAILWEGACVVPWRQHRRCRPPALGTTGRGWNRICPR